MRDHCIYGRSCWLYPDQCSWSCDICSPSSTSKSECLTNTQKALKMHGDIWNADDIIRYLTENYISTSRSISLRNSETRLVVLIACLFFLAACPSTAMKIWWTPITWPSALAPPSCPLQKLRTRSPARPMSMRSSKPSSSTTRPSFLTRRSLTAPCTRSVWQAETIGECWDEMVIVVFNYLVITVWATTCRWVMRIETVFELVKVLDFIVFLRISSGIRTSMAWLEIK